MGFKPPDVNGPVDKTIGFKKTRNGETILMNFPKPKNTLISYAHDCKIFHLSPNSSSLPLTQPLLHPVADLLLLRRCSSLTPAFFLQPISSIRSHSSPSSPSKVVLFLDPLSPISLFSPSRSDPSSLQLKEYIDDTEDFINIKLGNVQNQLIQFELLLTAATFVATIFAVVTGVFGMNFPATVFDYPYAFNWVLLITGLACVLLYFTLLFYFRQRKFFPL